MTNMSTRSIILRSFMMRVSFLCFPYFQDPVRTTHYPTPDTREEDLTHPEDIAHFRKHDLEADEEVRQERLDRMPIVEQNIPQKFRRDP